MLAAIEVSSKIALRRSSCLLLLIDLRWEVRGTEDRGIISQVLAAILKGIFVSFSQSCVTRFSRFIGSLSDLRSCNQTSLSPSSRAQTLGLFYHNSQIPICVCFGDRLLNIDLALTFISCCMKPKQSCSFVNFYS